jgi:Cobalamin-independent synthase, Catalytic domain
VTRAQRPWPAGAVTGIGSLPGTDPVEAARFVIGELPDLPHLPELPGRGAGAEMVGRTAALLVDLPVEISPTAWRIASHAGRDVRRAKDFLARDLDALEAQTDGYSGALKVQIAGPWTLAASIELPGGHRILTDHGAVRDLAASLTEGLRIHLADLARRMPGASLVVQVDEPSLPSVLAGTVPTPSGYGTVRSVEAVHAEQTLRDLLLVVPVGGRVLHCCAPDAPLGLLRSAGADALAIDAALLGRQDLDTLGEAVDAGTSLWLGVVPSTDSVITLDASREQIKRLWGTLGFPFERLAETVVPTPSCGLAAATPAYARRALTVLRDVGRSLLDDSA